MNKIGDRVVAIRDSNENEVNIYGYGKYLGEKSVLNQPVYLIHVLSQKMEKLYGVVNVGGEMPTEQKKK